MNIIIQAFKNRGGGDDPPPEIFEGGRVPPVPPGSPPMDRCIKIATPGTKSRYVFHEEIKSHLSDNMTFYHKQREQRQRRLL